MARSNGSPSLELVIQGARAFGIDAARYEDYADRRWGSGWKLNVSGRRAALEEIERYRNDPDGYPRQDPSGIGKELAMIRDVAQFSDLHYSSKNLKEADRCFSYAVGRAIDLAVDVAVISGDATDHALDVHAPAVERLARNVRRLADHCPVLMLQGTYSHEPPGTLSIFRLLGGCYPSACCRSHRAGGFDV